ncbi:hypothetical protein Tsubulata_029936, partial [Turnera subulata]
LYPCPKKRKKKGVASTLSFEFYLLLIYSVASPNCSPSFISHTPNFSWSTYSCFACNLSRQPSCWRVMAA